MVKLKFIVRSNALTLRISEGKERYYKSVKNLLKDNPNIERHWNDEKERFSCRAASHAENNKILDDFKESYLSLIKENPELSANQIAQYHSSSKEEKDFIASTPTTSSDNVNLVDDFLITMVENVKNEIENAAKRI